jgi:hypothetical protein
MSIDALRTELINQFRDLLNETAFCIQDIRDPERQIVHRPDDRMQIGSCFKAMVAAAFCKLVDQNVASFEETLPLTALDRIPDSQATHMLPEGQQIPVIQVLRWMIGVSDNTATEMIMRRLGYDRVQVLIEALNLTQTYIHPSLKQFADTILADRVDGLQIAPTSSMSDLATFYREAFKPGFFKSSDVQQKYLEIMRQEDIAQQSNWPDDILCYRKGGYLEAEPFHAMALGGVLLNSVSGFVFAFACNIEVDEQQMLASVTETFGKGLSTALIRIATELSEAI